MALFKKNTAPDELPDLAIDELKKELKKESSEEAPKKEEEIPKEEASQNKEEISKTEEKAEVHEEVKTEEEKEEETDEEKANIDSEINDVKPKKDNNPKNIEPKEIERSFFNPLLEELRKENFDPSKINSWYQKNFSEKGVVEGMKEYWERQKSSFITQTIENEFKIRINEKMNSLQKLEAEWQEIYISLIKKEEEMKKEENNIKKIINDFSQIIIKENHGKKREEETVKKKANLKKEHKSK